MWGVCREGCTVKHPKTLANPHNTDTTHLKYPATAKGDWGGVGLELGYTHTLHTQLLDHCHNVLVTMYLCDTMYSVLEGRIDPDV
jgi:hypothetical protein